MPRFFKMIVKCKCAIKRNARDYYGRSEGFSIIKILLGNLSIVFFSLLLIAKQFSLIKYGNLLDQPIVYSGQVEKSFTLFFLDAYSNVNAKILTISLRKKILLRFSTSYELIEKIPRVLRSKLQIKFDNLTITRYFLHSVFIQIHEQLFNLPLA